MMPLDPTAVKLGDMALNARRWLLDHAAPLWLERGVDRRQGAFFDALDQTSATNVSPVKRLRTLSRQIYVFSSLERQGVAGARDAMEHGLSFLLERARLPGGSYARLFDLDGHVVDPTPDFYDLAFVLFALAHAFAVRADAELANAAAALLQWMQDHLGAQTGGFAESVPPRLPRRQNPHMHLLEAALAWREVAPQSPVAQQVEAMLALFRRSFFDAATGSLREFFAQDLSPAPGDIGRVTEPGHHFEWIWLLRAGAPDGQDWSGPVRALHDFAHRHGRDRSTGFLFGAVDMSGKVLDPAGRLWAHCEWVRAEAVLAQGAHGEQRLMAAWHALSRFLAVPTPGLWHDRWDGERFSEGPAPATSLYHLVGAVEALCLAGRKDAGSCQ